MFEVAALRLSGLKCGLLGRGLGFLCFSSGGFGSGKH